MNITKENLDALNAVIKVEFVEADYKEKVDKLLLDYRKKANIPGFRKGQVPMGMIKKQYGKSVLIDEVNKMLQSALGKYIVDEKLDILGNPLPRIKEDFNWDAPSFSFEFELGLAPQFDIDLSTKNSVQLYKISATESLIDEEVQNIQARYGKMSSIDEVTEQANVTVTFVNEEMEINKKSTFRINELKNNKNVLIGAKVGDVVALETKGMFEDDHRLQHLLGVSHDIVHGLDITVDATIEDITKTELADLDQDLFDKLFPDNSVTTATELREKIKEDAEKQFEQQADQQFLNDVIEYLINHTQFDLPATFLQKWLQTAGEKPLTQEEAIAEYNKSEKGLRYQLMEGKIQRDHNITIDYKELVDYAKGFIRSQMAQFGNLHPEEKELEDIAGRILQNQEEAQKLQSQLLSQKILKFYKETVNFETKDITYEEFIEKMYH
ncbi:MAG: trigger factor [Flavobacteriia bacterium]|nr:trigger factor [Flavobacteriia bacterium]OIP48138.1 MAG: trigger factor [Flavobacteriaceae bacterium CG2_30_31_66]PIV97844.1 MAG: trigger factor [Flavobacteriaceae bacterium CG17_big_fil_post_rev_8_21_14_2_50_31_13]PIX11065.1 MAG: trigger factor [Flavobacteriaceae bacterium CG_4_8_14_3_um_filter_31_8]PIY14585.1 MAG: trigger factor [Flavobacteriaceae bacterium CG_4_10_14_3_um_filter_31_253]PIZ10852.1 MAG: trigger factor [Flavobacteriaceae bacterium CG_4_10_14_0_8_um_filter_31_99]PJC08659.1 